MKHKKKLYTLELYESSMDVIYRYYPAEEEVTNYGDGTGYPGYPATVEIDKVWAELKSKNGRKVTVDVLPFILETDQDLTNLEEMIIEYESNG